jgi:hypothetical protein
VVPVELQAMTTKTLRSFAGWHKMLKRIFVRFLGAKRCQVRFSAAE